MVYVTGDTHRDFDRISDFCTKYGTTKDDVLVILGDVSINYFLDSRDRELKKYLSGLEITLLCVHGNHEERPFMIDTYREREWRGGVVYCEEEFPTLLFEKDKEIYNLEGKKAIAVGGAYSVDKQYWISSGAPWFPAEQPSQDIMDHAEEMLNKIDWHIDVVLSHTAPLKYEPTDVFLTSVNQGLVDKTTERWLDSIEDRLDYGWWYCGHYHCSSKINRFEILFEECKVL